MSTASLPDPLVPADVDLTTFSSMPLDVRRLRDSRFALIRDAEAFRSALLLWCAAWHQRPASSLPNDDDELAQLAGFGRAINEWQAIRSGALYGFIECADGRLYHPVIAEKAIEAWNKKREFNWARECDRTRKANKARKEEGLAPLISPPKPVPLPQLSAGMLSASVGSERQSDGNNGAFSGNPAENALKVTEGNVREFLTSQDSEKPNRIELYTGQGAVR